MAQSLCTSTGPTEEEIARAAVASSANRRTALGLAIRGAERLDWIAQHGVLFGRVGGFPNATIALKRAVVPVADGRGETHLVGIIEIPHRNGSHHVELRDVLTDPAGDAA